MLKHLPPPGKTRVKPQLLSHQGLTQTLHPSHTQGNPPRHSHSLRLCAGLDSSLPLQQQGQLCLPAWTLQHLTTTCPDHHSPTPPSHHQTSLSSSTCCSLVALACMQASAALVLAMLSVKAGLVLPLLLPECSLQESLIFQVA